MAGLAGAKADRLPRQADDTRAPRLHDFDDGPWAEPHFCEPMRLVARGDNFAHAATLAGGQQAQGQQLVRTLVGQIGRPGATKMPWNWSVRILSPARVVLKMLGECVLTGDVIKGGHLAGGQCV